MATTKDKLPPTSEDRRQHPRVRMAVDVNFQSENNFFSAKTRDISAGGLFIDTAANVPIGTTIRVDLHLLKSRLRLMAEVAWVLLDDDGESIGVGVRFLDVPEADRQRIQAFMGLRDAMNIGESESDEDEDEG